MWLWASRVGVWTTEAASSPAASAPKFVTEAELEKLKALRGGSVEDGTASADRPLHEVLRENKEKKARRLARAWVHNSDTD